MAVLPPDPVFRIRNADMSPVHSLAFHFLPGGLERLLAGSRNGYVYAYNLQTNRIQQKLQIGKEPILGIYHLPYSMITQEKGGIVKLWQLTESGYTEDRKLDTDHSGFCRFAVCSKNEKLFLPFQNTDINIYDVNGQKLSSLSPKSEEKLGAVMCFKHIELLDNPYLLAGYEGGTVCLWDLKNSRCISSLKLRECPMALDYDVASNRGICGNASEVIEVFSIGRSDMLLMQKGDIIIKNAGINMIRLRSDKKVFVSGGWDGRLRIFSWKSLRPLVVLAEHKSAVQDVVYSESKVSLWNANIMAAGSLDGLITLWDLYK